LDGQTIASSFLKNIEKSKTNQLTDIEISKVNKSNMF
jgi:hypothetical protein